MLKRIFFFFLAASVLLTVCILPAAAAVVTEDNQDTVVAEALLTLEEDSLNRGSVANLSYKTSNFTYSPTINYPFMGEYLYDPSGYTCFVYLPTSEYNANVFFYANFAQFGGTNYPGYEFTDTLEVGSYTVIYYSFTLLEYMRIFGSYQYPDVFNISCSSNYTGTFSFVNWGFCSNSAFKTFRNTIDSLISFNNGIAEGSTFLSSPFLSSELSLSYYYQGSWINIPITIPDLKDYITGTTVNLNILQNLGIDSADIPSNNGGLRLCFSLPYAINMSAFSFGAFVPNNLVLRYDPADIRSERFGVWFNNTISNFSLWPLRSIAEGNTFMYDYNFPPNRSLYNQICIELNENALRSVLASNIPVSDYVSYRLVDFNATYGSGYDAGYDVGYGQGEQNGYNNGKQQGYLEGKAEGLQMSQNGDFFSLFSALIDAPVSAFTNLLSFEIFNQNVASFVLSILSLILVFKIVKVVI